MEVIVAISLYTKIASNGVIIIHNWYLQLHVHWCSNFKRYWTLIVITQNNGQHTDLLGKEQWRAVVRKKSLWEMAPWSDVVCETKVISHSIAKYFTWSLLLGRWKQTNLCSKGSFLPLFSECNIDDRESKFSHQVKILVFDNYQRWQVHLSVTKLCARKKKWYVINTALHALI